MIFGFVLRIYFPLIIINNLSRNIVWEEIQILNQSPNFSIMIDDLRLTIFADINTCSFGEVDPRRASHVGTPRDLDPPHGIVHSAILPSNMTKLRFIS